MNYPKTKRQWDTYLGKLRKDADDGDTTAMETFGLNVREGIRNRHGRLLVRQNSRLGFLYLLKAATLGNANCVSSVGYSYDVGLGVKQNKQRALWWYKRAARNKDSIAFNNIATIYRDKRKFRLMFQWWKRGAITGKDGDSAVDAGYCYQYGIGTKCDVIAARRLYRYASKSTNISEWGREAAMYHLAVSYIDKNRITAALPLLERANRDNDYPEANKLLEQIKAGKHPTPCRCRRMIRKSLPGHKECPIHKRT